MKKIFKNIFLSLALTACAVTPFAIAFSQIASIPQKSAGDYIDVPSEEDDDDNNDDKNPVENDDQIVYSSLDDATSYVLLEELWNEETNSFYSGTVNELFNLIGGKSGTTIEDIKTLASSTKKASNLRTNTYKKKSTQDINVMLGGLEWTVCYLSNDKNGNPILTLWLSNSTQEKFKDREQDEGAYYGFYDSGLYSSFYTNISAGGTKNYPSNMYGTSYVRAVTLNNGGKYSSNGQTLTEVEQNENSVFSLFTMEGNGLTDYIVKPVDVSWQEYQSAKELGHYTNNANDAWGEMSDANFTTNYSGKEGNDTWKNDNIWLVSVGDILLWGTNAYQKANYDGITPNLICSVGAESKSPVSTQTLMRSGHNYWGNYGYFINLDGNSTISSDLKNALKGIRPALHLNLNAIAESLSEEDCYEIVYDLDGGKSGVYPTKMENTNEFILTNPTKSGYKFLGWQISGADYSTAMFGKNSANLNITSADMTCYVENCDKLHFKNLTSTSGGVTFKAIWQETGEVIVEYKSYDDYFTDYDISSSTITENDLSGSGTSTDPYRVKTTKGFLYLTNKAKSGINLTNKYIEIECDIVLNDETFDEKGNPLSGDGIVYSWQPIATGDCYFNGNNHTIFGLYYNNQTKSFSLFGVTPKLIENLKLRNVFVRVSGNSGILVLTAQKIINCHLLNGTMIASGGLSGGLARYVNDIIENCSNGVDIIGSNSIAGIAYGIAGTSVVIKDCVNYGNVTSSGISSGIISKRGAGTLSIENCNNYGHIKGTTIGGIFGYVYTPGDFKKGEILNCVNYGKIESCVASNGYAVGGIAGCIDCSWDIYNCTNYGSVSSVVNGNYEGSLVGRICAVDGYNKDYEVIWQVNIIDCKSYQKEATPVFGMLWGTFGKMNLNLTIEGLIAEYDVDDDMINNIFSEGYDSAGKVNIINSQINIKCHNYNAWAIKYNSVFENVLININCKNFSQKSNYLFRIDSNYNKAKGVILNINSSTTSIKQYYGSSFRDFYLDWKTNKIGLSALDGVGTFQGRVTEEWLKEKGFVKKD